MLLPVEKYSSVLIESIELFGGSAVSYASASQGDLFRLAMQIGGLIRDFKNAGARVFLVSPRRWKGQLNYEQLRHILAIKFFFIAKNDHQASAYGIGLWAKGLL
jgi:hypothetical protein